MLAKGGGDKKSDHRGIYSPGDPPTLAEQGVDKELAKGARGTGSNQYRKEVRGNKSPAPTLSEQGVDKELAKGALRRGVQETPRGPVALKPGCRKPRLLMSPPSPSKA